MKCPHCEQLTISFRTWCRTPNAFSWQCPHCGIRLRANLATWAWFAVGLLLLVPILGGVMALEHRGVIAKNHGKPFIFGGVVLLVLPVSYCAFRRGGYVMRDS